MSKSSRGISKSLIARSILTLLVICVVLTGCKKNESSTSTKSSATTVEATSTDSSASKDKQSQTKRESTKKSTSTDTSKKTEILIAAAASLQNALEELQKLYKETSPNSTISFTFGSSGALQQQIEQGAPADVFISAAQKQMNALVKKDLIKQDTVVNLLENKLVLVVPKNAIIPITEFKYILNASKIGLGDPASVPAGQYAEEVFTNLGILDDVKAKAVLAKDVTEVLTWVKTGNVDAGVVYATDAASTDEVKVAAEAPKDSCSKIIYPAGIVKATKSEAAAKAFIEFLSTDEAKKVFESYGFVPIQ